jgi:dihydrofolate reductase
MRKVIVSNLITLDGFLAGPNGEIDWHVVDEEFFTFANQQLNSADTLLFGRVTYEGMASYWPTPAAVESDPIVSGQMNSIAKIVFSKTLGKAEWQNTRLVKGDLGDEIRQLKQQAGKDMLIFGSSRIVSALTNLGLIDEYRIFVNPLILGSGKPLFAGVTQPVKLRLLRTTTYQTGVVSLDYAPAPK